MVPEVEILPIGSQHTVIPQERSKRATVGTYRPTAWLALVKEGKNCKGTAPTSNGSLVAHATRRVARHATMLHLPSLLYSSRSIKGNCWPFRDSYE
jgi:hypothetical protein